MLHKATIANTTAANRTAADIAPVHFDAMKRSSRLSTSASAAAFFFIYRFLDQLDAFALEHGHDVFSKVTCMNKKH